MDHQFPWRCIVFLAVLIGSAVSSVAQPITQRYRDVLFSSYQLKSDIAYGSEALHKLDIYLPPVGDADTLRPLLIYIHGGGFKDAAQTKVGKYQTRVCTTMVRCGYVVSSINYRLTNPIPNDTVHFEALIRAVQDGKAAIRFFRRHAREYGIDTSKIFVTGSSAGAITALHLAYLDEAELPSYLNSAALGSLEGSGGNIGYSSRIHGVINCWGALGDTSWMKPGDVPVFSVHGENDSTIYFRLIPADGPFLYGSKFIHERALQLGIPTGLKIFPHTGHTLDNSAAKQQEAIGQIVRWLYQQIYPPTSESESVLPAREDRDSLMMNPGIRA